MYDSLSRFVALLAIWLIVLLPLLLRDTGPRLAPVAMAPHGQAGLERP